MICLEHRKTDCIKCQKQISSLKESASEEINFSQKYQEYQANQTSKLVGFLFLVGFMGVVGFLFYVK